MKNCDTKKNLDPKTKAESSRERIRIRFSVVVECYETS